MKTQTSQPADQRTRQIARASLVSIIGNVLLSGSKLVFGLLAGSLAVLADGIDSATDVVISCISLVATSIMNKPSDVEHPYGHGRAETIATTLLAFVIVLAGIQLVITTGTALLSGVPRPLPNPLVVGVVAISIGGKLLLAWNQFAVGKKTQSALLIANGINMRNDVLISSSVLAGLVATLVFQAPIIDPILGFLLGLWIIKTGVRVFLDVNNELMEGTKDYSLYQDVFDAVKTVESAQRPHRLRIRKMANLFFVDLDIEVHGDMSVTKAHAVAHQVEAKIKERIPAVCDVMVHVEPAGDDPGGEGFGVTESSLKTKER